MESETLDHELAYWRNRAHTLFENHVRGVMAPDMDELHRRLADVEIGLGKCNEQIDQRGSRGEDAHATDDVDTFIVPSFKQECIKPQAEVTALRSFLLTAKSERADRVRKKKPITDAEWAEMSMEERRAVFIEATVEEARLDFIKRAEKELESAERSLRAATWQVADMEARLRKPKSREHTDS